MAVDYDGSKTAFDSSANYTAQEFANDVVYTIMQVCDDENVPHPTIIQESGRYLSAYHAILVTNVLDEIETVVEDITPIEVDDDDPQVVIELADLRETHHGQELPRVLPRRARTPRRAVHALQPRAHLARRPREGRGALLGRVRARRQVRAAWPSTSPKSSRSCGACCARKYLTNFSVFRSVPDHWALDQLFPIIPIHRLNKPPTEYATLCDITCDSDGVVDKFVDLHDVKQVLGAALAHRGRALLHRLHARRRVPGGDGQQPQPLRRAERGAHPHRRGRLPDQEGRARARPSARRSTARATSAASSTRASAASSRSASSAASCRRPRPPRWSSSTSRASTPTPISPSTASPKTNGASGE